MGSLSKYTTNSIGPKVTLSKEELQELLHSTPDFAGVDRGSQFANMFFFFKNMVQYNSGNGRWYSFTKDDNYKWVYYEYKNTTEGDDNTIIVHHYHATGSKLNDAYQQWLSKQLESIVL